MKHEMEQLGIQYLSMDSGVVEIVGDLSVEQRELLHKTLRRSGMILLGEEQSQLIERLEEAIYDMVFLPGEGSEVEVNDAAYLSKKLNQDFTTLTHLFSEGRGVSIEQYIMIQKIERAKEWLLYENISVSEMAKELRFRNPSHLSYQFKLP